jgi:hypothetical protein
MMENKVVGHGTKKASEFKQNPKNWRLHPEEQRAMLSEMISRVGFISPVIVNVTTGNLIDGHARVKEMLDAGDVEVPYVEVELTEQEEAEALVTFDPITEMAERDQGMLGELIDTIEDRTGIESLLDALEGVDNLGDPTDRESPDDFPDLDVNDDMSNKCPKCGYEWD